MEIRQETILDNTTADWCFSIRKQNYVELQGEKATVGLPERRAFCPGEFDALKEYAPEFEGMVRTVWAPETIAAWNQKQVEIK